MDEKKKLINWTAGISTVIVALLIIIVVMVVIHRRKEIKKDSKAELQDDIQETPRRARHSRKHE